LSSTEDPKLDEFVEQYKRRALKQKGNGSEEKKADGLPEVIVGLGTDHTASSPKTPRRNEIDSEEHDDEIVYGEHHEIDSEDETTF
jgi:hypothetical protein